MQTWRAAMSVYCSLCLCMLCSGMEEVGGGKEGDERGKIEGGGKRGGEEGGKKRGNHW